MRDYFSIGPTTRVRKTVPHVGQPDYRRKALAECQRFIELIRTLGPEPEGAELAIKSFPMISARTMKCHLV